MPHAVSSNSEIVNVQRYTKALGSILQAAREIREDRGIEQPLTRADVADKFSVFEGLSLSSGVEAAARDVFYDTLATAPFDSSEFVDVWNLLDVCQIFCDDGICESGLTFWLVEELLESLMVEQCRSVFDYLEHRREIMTARHMSTKKLIILRACNELLKRLSRAEDTAFSGRVFIYLFQSLEFGDRSAVNLRGYFHVENVTNYNGTVGVDEAETQAMEVDSVLPGDSNMNDKAAHEVYSTSSVPTVLTSPKEQAAEQSATLSKLYPVFWSIQKYFCQPTTLFEPANLGALKGALEATLAKFKEVQRSSSPGSSSTGDDPRPKLKRKWEAQEEITNAINPKYLTSPDLFELEISDLAFRRHILVQGLILMDFLLYQTPKSKKKIESVNGRNKSVVYSFTLSDEETQWATNMRAEIASYLQQGTEGKFYYRMVDTVLSRDKNWVFWKAESCRNFTKNPIPAGDYVEARDGANTASATKRIRPNPMGALDLGFLQHKAAEDGLAKLGDSERYTLPPLDKYRGGILDNDMDIDMAKDDGEKAGLIEAKTSKTWRTLRMASRSELKRFIKVDEASGVDALFQGEESETRAEDERVEEEKARMEEEKEEEEKPMAESAPSEEPQTKMENVQNEEAQTTLEEEKPSETATAKA